jgi:hypothetical protein
VRQLLRHLRILETIFRRSFIRLGLQFGIAQGLKLTFCKASEIIVVAVAVAAAVAEDGSPNETDENIILK